MEESHRDMALVIIPLKSSSIVFESINFFFVGLDEIHHIKTFLFVFPSLRTNSGIQPCDRRVRQELLSFD